MEVTIQPFLKQEDLSGHQTTKWYYVCPPLPLNSMDAKIGMVNLSTPVGICVTRDRIFTEVIKLK